MMPPGDTLTGRRVAMPNDIERPGDYSGPHVGWTGDLRAVMFLKPGARDEGVPHRRRSVQHVCSPPHTFTEEPDGSLTISPSISSRPSSSHLSEHDDGWHGYLERGVWREV